MDKQYRTINEALPSLAGSILHDGQEVGSRAGRVFETMHNHIVIEQPWQREVLVPGRKASLPAQIAETMWVLAGRSDVEFLSHYLPRAADFSDDGVVWRGGYGPRIRGGIDQLGKVVELLRKDPTSRRAVIAIFDGQEDWVDSKDIPCNDLLVFSSRLGYLDLSVHVRSNDLVWGFSGINQFEWSALQEIVAGMLGLRIGATHYHTVSLHMYDRHWQKATGWGWTGTALADSPRFSWNPDANWGETPIDQLDALIGDWFALEAAIRNGGVANSTLAQIHSFPEPMLRSWLQVLLSWWGRGPLHESLHGTRLEEALRLTPRGRKEPVVDESPVEQVPSYAFADELATLHAEKSAAYGDSWKRRGELLGILANIARKVDRLGVTDSNETSADTAADLLIYIVKYRLWLEASKDFQFDDSDNPKVVAERLRALAPTVFVSTEAALNTELTERFEDLFRAVQANDRRMVDAVVGRMEIRAWELAFILWSKDQAKPTITTLPGSLRPAHPYALPGSLRPAHPYALIDGVIDC